MQPFTRLAGVYSQTETNHTVTAKLSLCGMGGYYQKLPSAGEESSKRRIDLIQQARGKQFSMTKPGFHLIKNSVHFENLWLIARCISNI